MHKDLSYEKFCKDQIVCSGASPDAVYEKAIWFIRDFIVETCASFEDKFVVDLKDFEV